MRSLRPTQVLALVGFTSLVAAIVYPIVAPKRTSCGHRSTCLSNVKRQAIGLIMYASDFDDRLAPSATWMDAIYPYGKNWSVNHCPALPKNVWGYAYDRVLGGQKISEDPSELPMVYDSTNGARKAADLVASLPKPGRHRSATDGTKRDSVAYVDGHARSVSMP